MRLFKTNGGGFDLYAEQLINLFQTCGTSVLDFKTRADPLSCVLGHL